MCNTKHTMNTAKRRFATVFSLVCLSQLSYAQSGSGSNYLLFSLIAVGLVLLVFAVLSLADNLIQIEGQKAGVDTKKTNLGIFPTVGEMFGKKTPLFVNEGETFTSLKKGFDLKCRLSLK